MADGNTSWRTASLEILKIQIGLFGQSANYQSIRTNEYVVPQNYPYDPNIARPDNQDGIYLHLGNTAHCLPFYSWIKGHWNSPPFSFLTDSYLSYKHNSFLVSSCYCFGAIGPSHFVSTETYHRDLGDTHLVSIIGKLFHFSFKFL